MPSSSPAATLALSSTPSSREHEHRVGQAVDRRLRRVLRLQQLAERARAILGEVVGHGVEVARQLGQLVAAVDARAHREVAGADAPRRLAQARRAGAPGAW